MKASILLISLFICSAVLSQPTQQWLTPVWGSYQSNFTDVEKDMVMDAQNNIYITGIGRDTSNNECYMTVKLNGSGQIIWKKFYSYSYVNQAYFITLDDSNNVYVTGIVGNVNAANTGIGTVKYNTNGIQQWVKIYNSPDSLLNDAAYKIKFKNDTLYVAGYRTLNNTGMDAIIIKYSRAGVLLDTNVYDNSHTLYDRQAFYDFELSNDGFLYAIGAEEISGNWALSLVSFNRAGQIVYVKRYIGPNYDAGYKIKLFNSNLYVIGTADTNVGYGTRILTQCYKRDDGSLRWSDIYVYAAQNFLQEVANDLKVDASGNAFVSANTNNYSNQRHQILIKYDSTGARKFTNSYGLGTSERTSLALDMQGFAYLGVHGGLYGMMYKISNNGVLQWRYADSAAPPNTSATVAHIFVNNDQDIYVSGQRFSGISYDYYAQKLSQQNTVRNLYTSGNLNKPISDNQSTFDTINITSDNPSLILTDVDVTIDTVLHTNDSDLEFYLIHNSVTDTIIYQVGSSGDNFISTGLDDAASALIANGTAPFTGNYKPSKTLSVFNSGNHTGQWILKIFDRATGNSGILKAWSLYLTYTTSVGIDPISTEIPKGFSLSQNYPNPFNPNSKIVFQIAKLSNAKLIVYDILGREAATLVNGELKAGTYRVDFDASQLSTGVYFYRLETENFSETKKMILVK